jgi:hypothetical protein
MRMKALVPREAGDSSEERRASDLIAPTVAIPRAISSGIRRVARIASVDRLTGLVPFALLLVATIAVDLELARPFRSASVGFDSQASVLYFQRLVSGERLEIVVTTTGKPLITALFGALYVLTHDWRVLAWTTIVVHGAGIASMAYLAARVAGPVAAAFVGAALINDSNLLFDVGYALATPYAVLAWAAAGLAVSGDRPRYGVAGASLAVASLARIETLAIVGVALFFLVWQEVRSRLGTRPARGHPHARARVVPVVGVLGIPIILAHDLLLTGDPLFSSRAAATYAAGARSLPSPLDVATAMVGRYWEMAGVVLLAALGVVWLLPRRPAFVLGLIGLGPGVAVLLMAIAASHIAVPTRYLAPIDVAIVLAAGVGLGFLVSRVLAGPEPSRTVGAQPFATVGFVVVAIVAAVGLGGFYWQQSPGLRDGVRASLHLAIDTDLAEPYLSVGTSAPPDEPAVLVPVAVVPRVAVDLGVRLPVVARTNLAEVDVAAGYPSVGQIVFHDRDADAADPHLRALEISAPQVIGPVRLDPLFVDPGRGVWVVAVR